ncbi:MAG TPA: alpha/beta hydrolase [Ilumatobacteraceae bacterium]|nr:alpha/beta hydrolase [Ilumatobacteraceae bacterium]
MTPIATDSGLGWRTLELIGRGTTFAFDRPGPSPGAPTVVLLHGLTATGSLNWTPTIAALRSRYRVIALDHRGHGRGIRSEVPFTLEDCADDAVALIDALDVPRAIFVGYSMGGPIAQLVWRRHPDRVAGLVFCATAADFTTTPDHWPLVRALENVRRVTHLVPRSIRLRAARPFVGGLVSDPALRNEVLGAMNSHEERSIHEAERAIRGFRSTDWIGGVGVPVVVVVTERDRLVRPALQRHLAASIPGARTIEINAAHLAAFTRPELTASAVVAACDAIALPTARTPQRRFGERVKRLVQGRGRQPRPRGAFRR